MDLISYLEEQGIEYTIGPSKNVSKGFIGIQCPYPACSDRSNHCGIRTTTLRHHCLVCGRSGDMIDLIRVIENIGSRVIAYRKFKSFRDSTRANSDLTPPYQTRRTRPSTISKAVKFPPLTTKFNSSAKRYLLSRGFGAKDLRSKYALCSTDHNGWLGEYDFRWRIIIPIVQKWQITSFTSRDYTRKAKTPYFHLPKHLSVVSVKDSLYNFDRVRKGGNVILVEGVTDVWRIGDGAVAIFGKTMTDAQIELLLEKQVKRVYILLDSDAQRDAIRLEKILRPILPRVNRISLDTGDPAKSLKRKDIKFLRGLIDEKR